MRCLSEEFLHIDWDEEFDILYLEWKYYPGSKKYRESLALALKMAHQKKVRFWIANIPEPKLVLPEDFTWLHEVWFPELVSLPIEKVALILPVDMIQEMTGEYLNKVEASVLPFEIDLFDQTEKAYTWIKGETSSGPILHV